MNPHRTIFATAGGDGASLSIPKRRTPVRLSVSVLVALPCRIFCELKIGMTSYHCFKKLPHLHVWPWQMFRAGPYVVIYTLRSLYEDDPEWATEIAQAKAKWKVATSEGEVS